MSKFNPQAPKELLENVIEIVAPRFSVMPFNQIFNGKKRKEKKVKCIEHLSELVEMVESASKDVKLVEAKVKHYKLVHKKSGIIVNEGDRAAMHKLRVIHDRIHGQKSHYVGLSDKSIGEKFSPVAKKK